MSAVLAMLGLWGAIGSGVEPCDVAPPGPGHTPSVKALAPPAMAPAAPAPAAVVGAVAPPHARRASVGPFADDAWLGEDKLRHLGMSFAATGFSYGAARFVLEPRAAAVAAVAAGFAAGVAKEVLDLRAGRAFSLRDLAWDALGIATSFVLLDRTR